jgi:hypothetical protein
MAPRKKERRRSKARPVLASGRDIPPAAERAKLFDRIHRDWNVVGTYFGYKRVGNRWTRTPSLVCMVDSKPKPVKARGRGAPRRARMAVVPPAQRIPPKVKWAERKRTFAISTDVVQSSNNVQLQQGPVVGPGDAVRFGNEVATIGAVVEHPNFGRCATTAGHLVGGSRGIGRQASLLVGNRSIPAIVRQGVQQLAIDYALLAPTVPCDRDNLFQDRARIGPVFVPTLADLKKPLFVLVGDIALPTIGKGIHARLDTALGVFDDVILTDAVTKPGMSGAALVDRASRLWGFQLGTLDGSSFFLPALQVLQREFSVLA